MSDFKTKYTKVAVEVDETYGDKNYFGYIAVNFNLTSELGIFFADTYDLKLLTKIKSLFSTVANVMVDKEIRIEDASILIDLPSVATKSMAADVVRLVKQMEKEFDEKVG